VPLTNLLGWAVVGLVSTAQYQTWARRQPGPAARPLCGRAWLCPGLYFLVLVFNLTVTFAIAEWALGLCSSALALAVAAATIAVVRGKPRAAGAWKGIRA
jgi:putative membrane protein